MQYISVISSAAGVLASLFFAKFLSRCPTLPSLLSLAALAAAVSMLRLPIVMYILGDAFDGSGGAAFPDSNVTGVTNAAAFGLFAAYG